MASTKVLMIGALLVAAAALAMGVLAYLQVGKLDARLSSTTATSMPAYPATNQIADLGTASTSVAKQLAGTDERVQALQNQVTVLMSDMDAARDAVQRLDAIAQATKLQLDGTSVVNLAEFQALHPELRALYYSTVVRQYLPAVSKVLNKHWKALPNAEKTALKQRLQDAFATSHRQFDRAMDYGLFNVLDKQIKATMKPATMKPATPGPSRPPQTQPPVLYDPPSASSITRPPSAGGFVPNAAPLRPFVAAPF